MILSQIVAVSENLVIGKNNTLPWHLPEDLKFFREKTKGAVMIMGRKTFESLPGLLKGRYHIVISSEHRETPPNSTEETPIRFVTSLSQAIEFAESMTKAKDGKWPDEVFVVGGSKVFHDTYNLVNKIYITKIQHPVEGDVFYPKFDFAEFNKTEQIDRAEPFPFSFVTYTRK